MKVNFNNLRRQAVNKYNALCDKLNHAKIKDKQHIFIEGYGWLQEGDIVIGCEEIQSEMEDLRQLIGSIAMTYQDDKEFADVYSEMYPEDSEKRMSEFNPEAE